VNVSPIEFEAILRRRKKVLVLPVTRTSRPPVRVGKSYVLRSHVPVNERHTVAASEATPARRVLRFIDLAETPQQTMIVTVERLERRGDKWAAGILVGDYSDGFDHPRFLAARPGPPSGDYTTNRVRAAKGEPEPVSRETLARLSDEVRMREDQNLTVMQARALEGLDLLMGAVDDRRSRKRLRAAIAHVKNIKDERGL
jgi:hypothetical protein